MLVKALKPLTIRNSGALISIACGHVALLSDELGSALISAGLVVAATKSITANGTYDVENFAAVAVAVDVATLTYNANGGTGSVSAEVVGKGTAVTLSDGTGLTAPTDKEFAGWATTASAESPDVTSPYTVEADVTLYAVWVDAQAEG